VDWSAHAARAEFLAKRHEGSAELLGFYAELARGAGGDGTKPFGLAPKEFGERIRALAEAKHEPKVTPPSPNYCPCCGSPPAAGALREAADGARRSLICGHCAYEWVFPRILCPHCQEQRHDELPVYIAEQFPYLRVECCSTCKRYLICADLVKDPKGIPLVEDIAALPLHLWATDHGYTKVEPNLFGF